jgi:hypothetical protein
MIQRVGSITCVYSLSVLHSVGLCHKQGIPCSARSDSLSAGCWYGCSQVVLYLMNFAGCTNNRPDSLMVRTACIAHICVADNQRCAAGHGLAVQRSALMTTGAGKRSA